MSHPTLDDIWRQVEAGAFAVAAVMEAGLPPESICGIDPKSPTPPLLQAVRHTFAPLRHEVRAWAERGGDG